MSDTSFRLGALADTLGYQMRRAAGYLQSALEAELAPLDLRASEAALLILVGENPGRMQSDVARDLRIQLANMIPAVARLVSAGLLERVRGPGRSIGLHLTPTGERRVEEVQRVLRGQEEWIAERLAGFDKAQIIAALKAITCSP